MPSFVKLLIILSHLAGPSDQSYREPPIAFTLPETVITVKAPTVAPSTVQMLPRMVNCQAWRAIDGIQSVRTCDTVR